MNKEQKLELQETIMLTLPELFKAEKVTAKLLNEVACNVIALMHDGYSHFPLLNAIIEPKDGLTRNNRVKVISFFRTLLPSSYNEGTEKFGKKVDGLKKITRLTELRQEFLDSQMSFWDWCELNGKDEDKPATNWSKRLETALASAMAEDKGGMSDAEIATIIQKSGIGAQAILALFMNDVDVQEVA